MNGRTVRSAAKGRSLTFGIGSLEDGLVARPVLQFINEGVLPHVLLRGVYPLLSLLQGGPQTGEILTYGFPRPYVDRS